MTMIRNRWLVITLFGLVVALPLVVSGVGAARADRAAADLDPTHVTLHVRPEPLVPVSDSALAAKSGQSAGRLAQDEAVILAKTDFEDTTFPPTGWRVIDVQARNDHVADPRYLWSRQKCEVDPLVGGDAAAWAVGGGTEGQKLPCVSPYPATAKIWSWLTYQAIDLSQYPDGMQVRIRVRLDKPNPTAFSICGVDAGTGQGSCYSNIQANQVPWTNLETADGPMTFDTLGGIASAALVIEYQDQAPTGANFGAVVDNIVIEGLKPSVPTNTPTPPPTNTPRFTATPTPVPTQPLKYIQIPNVVKNFDGPYPTPSGPSATGVEVAFGTGVNPDCSVTGMASLFPVGIDQLCSRIKWWGQPGGTSLRWQWYKDGQQVDFGALNGTVTMEPAESCVYRCIGKPPAAVYEVRAYVGGATEATASGQAAVR
jgi:hypothetical protein